MSTYEQLNKLIDEFYDERADPNYSGDYSVTLTAEGRSVTFAVNSLCLDLIDDDELLLHINAVNTPN